MTDEQRIELEALITEREQMVAANLYHKMMGYTYPAYYESNFYDLSCRIRALIKKE